MKSNIRFENELSRIVQGALRLDIDKVRNYTKFLAEKFEKEGESSTAKHLIKLLEESDHSLRPTDATFGNPIPVDSESRFPLVELSPKIDDEPSIVISPSQWDLVREFISVAKSQSQLTSPLGGGSLSFLMYGPPGTGKNRLARYLAKEMGLDLYLTRLDGLISSYLGSTSKNIRAVFEFASKRPCILFLDEFDAIAKLRTDSQELGELKRVVNSFIQNLDTVSDNSIVLAATNHDSLLDAAIWRRFSYRLSLDLPNDEMRMTLWKEFGFLNNFPKQKLSILVDLSEGLSGSDIREVCERTYRLRAATNEKVPFSKVVSILANLSIGIEQNNSISSNLSKLDQEDSTRLLRERNSSLYSLSALASIFGMSKATVHRWVSMEG